MADSLQKVVEIWAVTTETNGDLVLRLMQFYFGKIISRDFCQTKRGTPEVTSLKRTSPVIGQSCCFDFSIHVKSCGSTSTYKRALLILPESRKALSVAILPSTPLCRQTFAGTDPALLCIVHLLLISQTARPWSRCSRRLRSRKTACSVAVLFPVQTARSVAPPLEPTSSATPPK